MKSSFHRENWANSYYPFGAPMPGRTFNGGDYRYGFNGQEKDDEVHGSSGTSYDYGARIYDSRLGRFLSIDPDINKYPWQSPYLFAANNPIWYIDLGGKGPVVAIKDVTAAFNDGKKASSFAVTIFVAQPTPGTRNDYTIDITGGVNPGHTFIKLTKVNEDGTQVERIVGFYPSESVNPVTGDIQVKGEFQNDEGHEYNVALKIDVTEAQFNGVISQLNSLDNAQYNLNTLNCTDVGLMCGKASDVKLPDTQGSWPGGTGSNPANLGEDMRKISGAITETGVATAVNITDAQISSGPVVTSSPGTPVVGNPQAPAPTNNSSGDKVESKKPITGN